MEDGRRGGHLSAALDFMERATNRAEKPFFLWWNSTRMHVWDTHLKKESEARPGWASTPTGWWSTTATSGSS